MYAELDYPVESLRYIKADGDSMYYMQIINPTDKELSDAGYLREDESFIVVSGGGLCL